MFFTDWMATYAFYIPCFYIAIICFFQMIKDLQHIHYLLFIDTSCDIESNRLKNDIINV